MMIGPSFESEIVAAGLSGLPFGWDEGGVSYGDALTDADRARIEAVVAAHDPEKPEPPPVPASISDRQFAQALAEMAVITRPEALEFVKRGLVPAALQSAIDAIADPDERFAADMQVSGATLFERSHQSTLALAHALGWSEGQMDALWRAAAAL